MKSLEEFIQDEYNKSIDCGCKARYYIDEIKEFYNNDIPNNIIKLIENREYDLYIDESLKTHDTNKLKDKLKKEYGDDIFFKDYNGKDKKSFYMILSNNLRIIDFSRKGSRLDTDFDNLEKFENILSFFNYYVSYTQKIDNKWTLFIEPRYSDNITQEVFDKHYYIYHFTDKKSAKSILENGLRIKKSKYREFPSRIFLYITDKKINDDKENICKFISIICNRSNVYNYGISILKIKNNNKFNIYNDTSMKEKEAAFTYDNIPKEFISEVNVDIDYKQDICKYYE